MSEEKVFDEAEWLEKAKEEKEKKLATQKNRKTNYVASSVTTGEEVEIVISRIEASHTDITANYHDWLNIGFALSDEFGASGLAYYHRVSRFYPHYNHEQTEKQFEACRGSRGSGITIKTFFHLAQNAGIDISHTIKPQSQLPALRSTALKPPKTVVVTQANNGKQSAGQSSNMEAPCPESQSTVPEATQPESKNPVPYATQPESQSADPDANSSNVQDTDQDGERPDVESSNINGPESDGQSETLSAASPDGQSSESIDNVSTEAGTPEDEENIQISEPIFNTPRLPHSVHHRIPDFLRKCCDMFSEDIEKDVLLVSSLTVLSACLPNLKGVYFDEMYSPHLFTFIAAPAGSGKGKVKWARYLGASIHFFLVEKSKLDKAEYERELEHYLNVPKAQREGMNHPVPPKRQMFYIPANSSSSGFIQALANNNFHGMIFETEADTLATTLRQERGNFCDVLRKSFHHESTTMFRRKDSEHTEVLDPHLAIVLAGTPKQIHNIMPNVENGLFSRFLYYAFEDNSDFRNPFISYRNVNYVEFFAKKGKLVMDFYETLQKRKEPILFKFTTEQGELFTERFNTLYKRNRLLLEDDFNASSRRMGLITFRIAMVLSALRMFEDGHLPDELVCSDTDFDVATQITFILEQHAIAVFRTLPDNQKKIKKISFFLSLPIGFTRQQYKEVAISMGIEDKTAQRYIRDLTKIGWLRHKHDWYTKIEFDPLKLWKK